MDTQTRDEIAMAFAAIALVAGQAIMAARASAADAQHKSDGSPVTQADLDADAIIRARLPGIMPGVPVISEEMTETHSGVILPARFILVDPLDGTREFVAGRDEFTVNIALIDDKQPIVGAIYAPALSRLYVGGDRALRADVRPGEPLPRVEAMRRLATCPVPEGGLRAIASRSHLDPLTKGWLDERRIAELRPAGSSLKFCAIAEGEADVYPRFGTTMEWDIAAGHAILAAAGGCVLNPDGSTMRYGKTDADFRNGSFIAWGRAPGR